MMSLTVEQLEMLCEMYHHVSEAPVIFEKLRDGFPHLVEEMAKSKPSRLVPIRLILNFFRNPKLSATASQLLKEIDAGSAPERPKSKEGQLVSKRQLDRDLRDLLESGVLVAEKSGKGLWAVPDSRFGERGRPSRRYTLNPLALGEYVWNDSVDNEMRKFVSFAQKFLSGTSMLKEASVRFLAALLDMATRLPELTDAFRRMPEIARMMEETEPDVLLGALENLWTIPLVIEETVDASILRSRIELDQEDLPRAEARRLGLLFGLNWT